MSRKTAILFLSLLALMLFLPFTQAQEKDAEPQNGLEILMKKHGIANSTAQVTPTICALCGLMPPETSQLPPLESVLKFWNELRGADPDAVVEKQLSIMRANNAPVFGKTRPKP